MAMVRHHYFYEFRDEIEQYEETIAMICVSQVDPSHLASDHRTGMILAHRSVRRKKI
jgi:hypothetical protein